MTVPMVKPKESGVFDNIGDAILSAFTKVRKPDPKFSEMKQKADKLEENLTGIEKLHSKMVKIETELGDKLKMVGTATVSMSNMETQMMGPLSALGTRLENYADFLKTKVILFSLFFIFFPLISGCRPRQRTWTTSSLFESTLGTASLSRTY
jgi:sorting nexin-4